MRAVRTIAVFLLGSLCIAAPAHADEQAQFDFANGLFARGFNEEAAAEYRNYLQQYPQGAQRPEAFYRLGEAEFALGKHAEALKAFDEFLAAFSQQCRTVCGSPSPVTSWNSFWPPPSVLYLPMR